MQRKKKVASILLKSKKHRSLAAVVIHSLPEIDDCMKSINDVTSTFYFYDLFYHVVKVCWKQETNQWMSDLNIKESHNIHLYSGILFNLVFWIKVTLFLFLLQLQKFNIKTWEGKYWLCSVYHARREFTWDLMCFLDLRVTLTFGKH